MVKLGKRLRPSLLIIIYICTTLLLCGGDIKSNPGTTQPLSINHINVRSLCASDWTKKLDDLHSILCISEQSDVICISESWLDAHIKDEDISLPDYQLFRRDRLGQPGGSVAMYIHESIPATRRTDIENQHLELVMTELTHQNKKFIIGTCYRPPGMNIQQVNNFLTNLQLVINQPLHPTLRLFSY